MKRQIITAAKKFEKQLRRALQSVKDGWAGWANIDIEISDDGRGLTFPDKENNPVALRIEVEYTPTYVVYDVHQAKMGSTQNIEMVDEIISEVIRKYRK